MWVADINQSSQPVFALLNVHKGLKKTDNNQKGWRYRSGL